MYLPQIVAEMEILGTMGSHNCCSHQTSHLCSAAAVAVHLPQLFPFFPYSLHSGCRLASIQLQEQQQPSKSSCIWPCWTTPMIFSQQWIVAPHAMSLSCWAIDTETTKELEMGDEQNSETTTTTTVDSGNPQVQNVDCNALNLLELLLLP